VGTLIIEMSIEFSTPYIHGTEPDSRGSSDEPNLDSAIEATD
jgi:hypothetical protein